MKKLLAFVLMLVLVLGLAGCGGGDPAFNGNFRTEATADEIAAFYADYKKAFEDDEDFEFEKSEISMKLDMTMDGSNVKINKYTMLIDSATGIMSGEIDMSGKDKDGNSASMKGKVYCDGEYYYFDGSQKGPAPTAGATPVNTSGKVQMRYFPDYSGMMDADSMLYALDFSDPEQLADDGIKVFIDKSNANEVKVKVDFKKYQEDETTVVKEAYVVLLFNSAKKLIGFQVVMDMSYDVQEYTWGGTTYGGYTVTIKGEMSVKQYTGEITLPTDLDSYKPE